MLSNFITNQWIHQKYGGVVPEAASRLHVEAIVELTTMALEASQLKLEDINAVAVANGPGLIGSLLCGVSFAKSISLSLGIPLIEVNHLHAHLLSLFIDSRPEFPMLVLTVSGGHTQLVKLDGYFDFTLIGQTIDDAAGEAFDKCGKLLNLPYPAGPHIDKLASNGTIIHQFPQAKIGGFDFSFSGLKTSVLYYLKDNLKLNPEFINQNMEDLCASIQYAIVEALSSKIEQAAHEYSIKHIGIAGGVAANSGLRSKVNALCTKNNWSVIFPKMSYCTDNAAMIAKVGYEKFLKGQISQLDMPVMARLPIQ